jgi:hypothetical protein
MRDFRKIKFVPSRWINFDALWVRQFGEIVFYVMEYFHHELTGSKRFLTLNGFFWSWEKSFLNFFPFFHHFFNNILGIILFLKNKKSKHFFLR